MPLWTAAAWSAPSPFAVHAQAGRGSRHPDAVLILLVRNGAGHYVTDRILDTTQQFVPIPAGWRIKSRYTTPFHPPTLSPVA